jgi:hypothetical protein
MTFCCQVHKAKGSPTNPKRFATAEQARVMRTAMKAEKKVVDIFVNGASESKLSFSLNDMADAYRTGKLSVLREELDTEPLKASLREIGGHARGVAADTAEASVKYLPKELGGGILFDQLSPRILRWSEKNTGRLITEVDKSTRAAISNTLKSAIKADLHPMSAAKQIRNMIGLNAPQSIAVENLRARMIADGVKREIVDARIERYSNQLLNQRAEMIARTEMSQAVNGGRELLWEQLIDDGHIDATRTQRQWVTALDERVDDEICAPMEGVTVPVDEEFDTPAGSMFTPPAHPGCRCTVVLVFK